MKKTVKINIGSQIFHIDEDAYKILDNYIANLNKHFKLKTGGKEVVDDIEARIAELFADKLNKEKQVINVSDVKSIIEIMGEPEVIFEEGSKFIEDEGEGMEDDRNASKKFTTGSKKTSNTETGHATDDGADADNYSKRPYKKLYRDPERSILGGVSGGLAYYLNIDIVWVRILFILLFIFQGFGLLLYIVFWIILPAARTSAQKLEMKGEPVTVSNIEKTIKDDYTEKDTTGENQNIGQTIIEGIGEIIKFSVKLFLFIIGVGLIFSGLFILFGFFGLFLFNFSWPFLFHDFSWLFHAPFFHHFTAGFTLTNVTFILSIIIPVIALLYVIIKALFNIKTKDRILGLTALILWFLSFSIFITLFFNDFNENKDHRHHDKEHFSLNIDPHKEAKSSICYF